MSPQTKIQYDNDMRSIGANDGIPGSIVSHDNGIGIALPP